MVKATRVLILVISVFRYLRLCKVGEVVHSEGLRQTEPRPQYKEAELCPTGMGQFVVCVRR